MDLFWLSNNSHLINASKHQFFEEFPDFEAISPKYQIFVITLYSITALIAFIANIITIIVLLCGTKSSPELSKYLISLSVSDIIMATFSIPFSYTTFMFGRWLFHPSFCPIVYSLQLYSLFVSIYTLIVIGIDRYYAIVKPLKLDNWSQIFPKITIFFIWTIGLVPTLVSYFNTSAVKFNLRNDTLFECKETWSENGSKIYTISMFCITFAFPSIALLFVYYRMVYAIRNRGFDKNLSVVLKRQKIQVIKLLVTVVVTFILCWSGIQIFLLIIWLFPQVLKFSTKAKYNAYVISYLSLHWLSMLHSCVNPFLYSFISENFRSDLKNTKKWLFNKLLFKRLNQWSGSRSSQGTTYSYVSVRSEPKDNNVELHVVNT